MRRFVISLFVCVLASGLSRDADAAPPPLDTPPPKRVDPEDWPLPEVPAVPVGTAEVGTGGSVPDDRPALALPATTDEQLNTLETGVNEAWLVDEQFAEDEADAFEAAQLFRDPGSMEEALEQARIAALQVDTQEFEEAERTIESSVAMIEEHRGRYDPELIGPLTVLGDAQAGQGEFPAAIETYERAIHVARINDGLRTPDQVEIVYKEAASRAAMGDFERANERHEYAYETLLRNYGPDSIELVPGMYKLAHWYRVNNNIFSARALYQYAVRALSLAYGTQDVRLIPALQGVADSYRMERFPPYRAPGQNGGAVISMGQSAAQPGRPTAPISVNQFSDGERALRQIVRIHEANPDATVNDVTMAILDLADWNLLFARWDTAFTLYEFSYKVLAENGQATEEQLVEFFGHPRPLYMPLPTDPAPPPADLSVVPTQGHIELRYTVTVRGAVKDLKTIESQPEGMMDFKIRRAMRNARFRPQIENGVAVDTRSLVYRHAFEYYPTAGSAQATGAPKASGAPEAPSEGHEEAAPDPEDEAS